MGEDEDEGRKHRYYRKILEFVERYYERFLDMSICPYLRDACDKMGEGKEG